MMTPSSASTLFARAAWIVDRSEVALLLDAGSRKSNRGAKRAIVNGRLVAILLIAAAESGAVTVARMVEIATEVLSREEQWRYGIRRDEKVLTTKQLYTYCEGLSKHLGTDVSYLDLDADAAAAELARREAVRNEIADLLIKASHAVERTGAAYAIDETAVWSWAIGRGKPKDLPPVDSTEGADSPDTDEDAGTSTVTTAEPAPRTPRRTEAYCPDSAWGVKTHKMGHRSAFFGFQANVLVRVPDLKDGHPVKGAEPIYVERFRLGPASKDVVDSSLELLDALADEGQPARELIGDRHYSFKKTDRWATQLWERGVHQVLDLREDEHGVRDVEGLKFIDGWAHCPGTPQALEGISRPGLTASGQEVTDFRERIEERWSYALHRNKTVQADGGKTQWACPAMASKKFGLKVGCPLRAGTVEVARECALPIVTPPVGADQLKCCTQKLVQVRPGPHVKHQQDLYWGTDAWERSWARRTYVEGVFGNLKNPSTENIKRGFVRMVGLPMVTLALAAAAVSYNIREYNNWLERTERESDHPLARETEWVHGHTMLTQEAAAKLDLRWSQNQQAA